MKTLFKITLILFVLNAFQSCSNDDAPATEIIAQPEPEPEPESEPEPEPQPIVPVVTSMSPLSGPKTTIVKFTGTDFGSDSSTIQVFFDEIEAEVQSVTETEITTVVPPRAFFGEAKLVINGTEITGFTFEYQIVDIQVTTIAGSGVSGFADGNGENAQFASPFNQALDTEGNLYVADVSNHRIRKITPNGDVSTFAGIGTGGFADGNGESAQFNFPADLDIDNQGNIYVVDLGNNKIRKITPSGVVSTLGFADGIGTNAQFSLPEGIMVNSMGDVYVVDSGNSKIRKITPDGTVTTFAGSTSGFSDGIGTNAQFNLPRGGITTDALGNIYVSDTFNHKIRKITSDGLVTTVAGTTLGFADGNSNSAQFKRPRGIAVDILGNIYVADAGNNRIRKIMSDGEVTTIAGSTAGFADGAGTNAQFNFPGGISVDDSFTLYVSDISNHKIRKITQE